MPESVLKILLTPDSWILDIWLLIKRPEKGGIDKLMKLSIDKLMKNLREREEKVKAGGAKIAFLHPKGTNGVLIELSERNE